MRYSNTKKTKTKILVILMIICLIVLIAIILGLNKIKKNEPVEKGKPIIDITKDGILNLSGFGVFFDKYSGHLKSSEIANKLEEITTKSLPEMYDNIKEYDEINLEKYYSENSISIKGKYGIENFEEFLNFIVAIKETNIDLQTWDRLDILTDTYIDESNKADYAYVEYEVTYSNSKKIKFSLFISRKANVFPTYIIGLVK